MLLDVKAVRRTPGASLPFSFELDLSGETFYGENRLTAPVKVEGTLYNRAGMLGLSEKIVYVVHTLCGRCARPVTTEKTVELDRPVADERANEEDDDILLIEDDCIDAAAVAEEAVVLDMDLVYLCRPDCKGLCPICGADRNEVDCGHAVQDASGTDAQST